jgi:ribonucleotide reductase beta subunit family protein with ferritin-like domain
MENIHAETYSLLLDTIVSDLNQRRMLLNAITTMPIIKTMADYMFGCINSSANFGERLLKMAFVEGVFFAGCFCAIYWLRTRGLMFGLCDSNHFIARDETLHAKFALAIYILLRSEHKCSRERIVEITHEAVNIAKAFINEALQTNLEQMNATLMSQYIECEADELLSLINEPHVFGSTNPFPFMEQIKLQNKTNSFERRVTEYRKADARSEQPNQSDTNAYNKIGKTITITDDF